MSLVVHRVIELAVHDAGAGGHALQLAGANDGAVAHVVLVLERTVNHVRDDLHVLVRVSVETAAGFDPVFVDDAQFRKTHHRRIVIVRKRKCMSAPEPAVVSSATAIGANYVDHLGLPDEDCDADCALL